MNWKNRKKIASKEKAVELLADYLSDSTSIHLAIDDDLDEAAAFAHKWDIPFDRDFHSKMIKQMNAKRWGGDEYHIWVSSSETAEC